MQAGKTAMSLLLCLMMVLPAASLTAGGEDEGAKSTFKFVKVLESPVDLDEDGIYEGLEVTVKLNVTVEGKYRITADLYTFWTEGEWREFVYLGYDMNHTLLAHGVHKVKLFIPGPEIQRGGADGPWHLDASAEFLETGEYADMTVRTSAYLHDDFMPYEEPVEFTGEWEEYTEDEDGDGFADILGFDVGVEVREEGFYFLAGKLTGFLTKDKKVTDPDGTVRVETYDVKVEAAWTEFEVPLFVDTDAVEVIFDGMDIHASGVDGPYIVNVWLTARPLWPLDDGWEEWEEEGEWDEGEWKEEEWEEEEWEEEEWEEEGGERAEEAGETDPNVEEGASENTGDKEEWGDKEDWEDPEGWEDPWIDGPFGGMPFIDLEFKSKEHSHKKFQVPRGPVEFTGDHFLEAVDEDGDGLFEGILIEVEVDVIEPMDYVVGASLFKEEDTARDDRDQWEEREEGEENEEKEEWEDKDEWEKDELPDDKKKTEVFYHHLGYDVYSLFLEEGIYTIDFWISGEGISMSGVVGPYTVGIWYEEFPWYYGEGWDDGEGEGDLDGDGIPDDWEHFDEKEEDPGDREGDPGVPPLFDPLMDVLFKPRWPEYSGKLPYDLFFETRAFTAESFSGPVMGGMFTGDVRDFGSDRWGTEAFEFLTVEASARVDAGGEYLITGELMTGDGWFITAVDWYQHIEPGEIWVEVDFDGVHINRVGVDGPYLAVLSISPVRISGQEGIYDGVWTASDVIEHMTLDYAADDFASSYEDRDDPPDGDGPGGTELEYDDDSIDARMDVLGVRFSKRSPEISFYYTEEGGNEVRFTLSFMNLLAFDDSDMDGYYQPGEELYKASLLRSQWTYREPAIKESEALGTYVSFSMSAELEMRGVGPRSDAVADWGAITFTYTVPEDDVKAGGEHALDVSGGSEVGISISIDVNHPLRASGLALEGLLVDDTGTHELEPSGGELRPFDGLTGTREGREGEGVVDDREGEETGEGGEETGEGGEEKTDEGEEPTEGWERPPPPEDPDERPPPPEDEGASPGTDERPTDPDGLPEDGTDPADRPERDGFDNSPRPAGTAGTFQNTGSGPERGFTMEDESGESHGFFSWSDSVTITFEDDQAQTGEVKVSYSEGPSGMELYFAYPYSSAVAKVEHSPTVGVVEENTPASKEAEPSMLERLLGLNPWLYVLTVVLCIVIFLGVARRRKGNGEEEGGGGGKVVVPDRTRQEGGRGGRSPEHGGSGPVKRGGAGEPRTGEGGAVGSGSRPKRGLKGREEGRTKKLPPADRRPRRKPDEDGGRWIRDDPEEVFDPDEEDWDLDDPGAGGASSGIDPNEK